MPDGIDWDSMYVPDAAGEVPLKAMVEKTGGHPQMEGWMYVKPFPGGGGSIAVPEDKYLNVGDIMDETGGDSPTISFIRADQHDKE